MNHQQFNQNYPYNIQPNFQQQHIYQSSNIPHLMDSTMVQHQPSHHMHNMNNLTNLQPAHTLQQRQQNIYNYEDQKRQKREEKLRNRKGGILGSSSKKRAQKCLAEQGQIQVRNRPLHH